MLGRATTTLAILCSGFGAACGQTPGPDAAVDPPPPAPREFRAAWIATVDNIDWPSRPGLSARELAAELDGLLDRAVRLRLNALVFQVRPACDAFYRSDLEPWSEWLTGAQGRAPEKGFDPLAHAVAGAHRRGLELHAWFNPYRARHPAADSPLVDDHVARRPGWSVRYGKYVWLDPGHPQVPAHVLRVILDVVDRYDIDGVHIDDYFYPYPERGVEFDDRASYDTYRRTGGELARDDWRRQNVDRFVEALHRGVKRAKPWVAVGISPFGIVRPGVPAGIQAGLDQYADLYADVRRWLDAGWCDYVAPQLYWPIADRPHSFATLLDWWAEATPPRMHLYPGLATYKAAGSSAGWSGDELIRQIDRTRGRDDVRGHIHYSMQWIAGSDSAVAARLAERVYERPALVPARSWLDADAPATPRLDVTDRDGHLELRWAVPEDAARVALYLRCGRAWNLAEVFGASRPGVRIRREQRAELAISGIAVAAVDRCGNESPRAVRAIAGQ